MMSNPQRLGMSSYGDNAYGPPMGNPYAYGSRYGSTGFGSGRMGGGFGGMGLPLLGGLAGGFLLGEALDDNNYGGGWGGGGFGDGNWGGGGFDNNFF